MDEKEIFPSKSLYKLKVYSSFVIWIKTSLLVTLIKWDTAMNLRLNFLSTFSTELDPDSILEVKVGRQIRFCYSHFLMKSSKLHITMNDFVFQDNEDWECLQNDIYSVFHQFGQA